MRRIVLMTLLAGLLGSPATAAELDIPALADADGDGIVIRDEFTAYYDLVWLLLTQDKPAVDVKDAPAPLRTMILSVLPKAEGRVDREQFREAASARYPDADLNKDGVVTLAEMKAWKGIPVPTPGR